MTRALLAIPLAAMLALVVPTSDAFAQQKPTPTAKKGASAVDKVNLQLMVVHATEGAEHIDPKLDNISKHLSMLRYNNFQVLQTNKAAVAPGRTSSFAVEGGRKVSLTVMSANQQRAQVRVEMFKQGNKLVDTTVSINRGSTLMVGGPRYDGGILLLPITASY